ncbi:hypothetical protein [uncultured Winogradskyella sp.]|uniref:hypothetical protein n=1 Tax=uncultured Winogradskyella sp. TaxID=395353 RepID=UPI0030D9252C|tara:strand:- start:2936 stop:3799 length:864 start_codon:yes stop_codon:yes gene_type:complete
MNKPNIISLIKICAFTVFIGRAYQFYFFGAPFRSILWDESLLTPIVEGLFNTSWYDYATSPKVNDWIEGFTKLCSVILFLAAVVSLFWDKFKFERLKRITLGLGLFILFLLGTCIVKDKNYDYFQFFELTMQFVAPILLLLNINYNKKKNIIGIKIAIAATFISHGLFAMGFIYLPGNFVDMTIMILGVNETQANSFLYIAGILDIVISILIFIPKLSKYALIYMILWGFATAFVRLFAGFNQNFLFMSIHGSTFLVIYRLSHGLIPLLVLLIEEKLRKVKIPTNES